MSEKCKYCDYVSKCSRICEYNSIMCRLHRSFPKIVDKSYEELQQESQQLKEQMVNLYKEFELNNVNTATEYHLKRFEFEINKRREENLKSQIEYLQEQLQQRDEVIEECIESIQNFMTHIDDGFCADMMTFIDILNKYKGE